MVIIKYFYFNGVLMLLLNIESKILKKDINKHLYFPFTVSEKGNALKIIFSYTPKDFENMEDSMKKIKSALIKYGETECEENSFMPLKNLITLSLISPCGIVGTKHNHNNNQEHIISEEYSSCGFKKTVITEGEWKIALSVFCILNEVIDFNLSVALVND